MRASSCRSSNTILIPAPLKFTKKNHSYSLKNSSLKLPKNFKIQSKHFWHKFQVRKKRENNEINLELSWIQSLIKIQTLIWFYLKLLSTYLHFGNSCRFGFGDPKTAGFDSNWNSVIWAHRGALTTFSKSARKSSSMDNAEIKFISFFKFKKVEIILNEKK